MDSEPAREEVEQTKMASVHSHLLFEHGDLASEHGRQVYGATVRNLYEAHGGVSRRQAAVRGALATWLSRDWLLTRLQVAYAPRTASFAATAYSVAEVPEVLMVVKNGLRRR